MLLLLLIVQPGQGFVLLLRPLLRSPSLQLPLPPRQQQRSSSSSCGEAAHPPGHHPTPLLWSSARDEDSAVAVVAAAAANDEPAVGGMALWELFRELERRGVVYSVLQPREELTRLLLEARRDAGGVGPAAAADAAAVGEEEEEAVMDAEANAPASIDAVEEGHEARPPPPPPPPAPADSPPAEGQQGEQRPRRRRSSSPSATPRPLVPPPVFASIADALAWAGKLSKEEIAVELDFLGVATDSKGLNVDDDDDEPTHSQLARLLARSVMGEGSEEDTPAASDWVASPPPPPPPVPGPQPKSKARQQRMLRELQQQGRSGGAPPGPPRARCGPSFSSSSAPLPSRARGQGPGPPGLPGDGGAERFLDVDHARDELVAMRDRALDAFGGLVAGGSGEGGAGSGSGERGRGRGRGRGRRGDREDLALRVFEKATRVADGALDWATRARSMARGAMIAATTTAEDVDPRLGKGKGKKGSALQKKAELHQMSQSLLGPRGRRWSKFTGLMARAWAESVWQVVMASATWAGGGLLPGKYVLLGAGAFALLLRQGLGAYMATLLVVRTCSSTLRNIIEDDDDDEEEDAAVAGGF